MSVRIYKTDVIGCFDMDGVLLDTEHIKLDAWSKAVAVTLEPIEEDLSAFNDYNRYARGVPRVTKFEHVLRTMGAPQSELPDLLARYAALLNESMAEPKPMPGAIEFLFAWPGPRWVVSSAPQADIAPLVARAGFPTFDRICGYPTTKTAALIAAKQTGLTVHFGDAPADREAAHAAGVDFVAVGAMAADPRDLAVGSGLDDLRGRISSLLEAMGR